MAKEYLYGKLNQETVRPNYGGSTTDSLIINVDNDKMVISGEVKWDAALGEVAHRAYPGDKGSRNYFKILELSAQLEEEISRAEKSRLSVESKVGELEKTVKTLNTSLTNEIRTEAALASEADRIIIEQCKAESERALKAESDLISALKQEVLSRESADTDLIRRLDDLSGVRDQLNTAVSRIDAEIDEHKLALIKYDVSTHQHDVDIADLQTDVKTLNNTDLELDKKIKIVDEQRSVDAEIHNAHYQELVSRLEQEIKRSIAADASLLLDTSRNSGRITSLQIDLTNVISKYVQDLMRADAELDERISYEHTQAEEYKEKILNEVEDVAAESLQRDNALQAQIEILTDNKNSVPLIENDGTIPEVYSQQGNKTFTVPLEKDVVPDSVVRRDSEGNVLLTTNPDVFTAHSAVSKLFVENIVSELRKEISSISFDFIDGGTAPLNE